MEKIIIVFSKHRTSRVIAPKDYPIIHGNLFS